MSYFNEEGHRVVRYEVEAGQAFVRCENHNHKPGDNYALGLASVPVGVWKVCPICHGEVLVDVKGKLRSSKVGSVAR